MMLTTPAASQNKAFPLAGIPNRLSLSESHTKHRISPSLPVRRNLLIKLNCAEMELANSLILAQTCRAGSRVNKDEQYSGSAEHKHCLGSVVIRNGCNNENQQVTGKEKGGTENTALWGYGFFHHELNQHLAARQDLQLVRNYSQNPHMLNDYSNLSHEENQHLADQHIRTCEIFVGQPVGASLALRRCSSSRATLTSRLISSLAVMPIASTCSSASSDESKGFSVAPSVWRLAISPRTAVTMNCAFVSPAFSDASISFTTSCGKRALSCCDLLLVELVDILRPLLLGGIQYVIKTNTTKDLYCDSLMFIVNRVFGMRVIYQFKHSKNSEAPRVLATPAGPLTTNDRLDIEVAMLNHTPTRFKFLFLAVHRSDLNAKPHRESATAHSEQDARRSLAGQFVLSFAGRLPEVNHA
ncbi:host cell division inhibitor Icd-like protein [Yersinia rochesterensis]|uniref:Host cell division inhibitor Icd-like protein n=2 Tax=Yersinia rochesterensis TaxID=1604335 RepID=A0A8D4N4V6_9GAMM|nr:host cell division inhibitor Icd-like protein [Yersinia rochesterensis]